MGVWECVFDGGLVQRTETNESPRGELTPGERRVGGPHHGRVQRRGAAGAAGLPGERRSKIGSRPVKLRSFLGVWRVVVFFASGGFFRAQPSQFFLLQLFGAWKLLDA